MGKLSSKKRKKKSLLLDKHKETMSFSRKAKVTLYVICTASVGSDILCSPLYSSCLHFWGAYTTSKAYQILKKQMLHAAQKLLIFLSSYTSPCVSRCIKEYNSDKTEEMLKFGWREAVVTSKKKVVQLFTLLPRHNYPLRLVTVMTYSQTE